MTKDEELEAPKVEPRSPMTSRAVQQPSGEAETIAPSTSIKRPQWFTQTFRDAQEYVEALRSTFRESRPSKKFRDYMALMSNIIDFKPSSCQEATSQQIWQDAMVEKYTSIVKNDVWKTMPRLEGKSVVGSKWIYKIKHVAYGNIEKFRSRFGQEGSPRKREWTMKRHLL
jgi:hypothetical protein